MTQTVLVTGGTGFVAQWLIQALLAKNYIVKTTIRSEAKRVVFEKVFSNELASNQLQLVIVPDLSAKNSLDAHLNEVDVLFAVASVFSFANITNVQKDLVDPAINIASNTYKSASAAGVRRIVYTGSMACVLDPVAGPYRDYSYTDNDYNTMSYEEGCSGDHYQAYVVGKAQAEQAVWKLNKEDNSGLEVAYLHMPWIMGPNLLPFTNKSELNESNQMIAAIINDGIQIPDQYPAFVDGRDLAEAHIALLQPQAAGKRYLVATGSFIMNNVYKTINNYVHTKWDVPKAPTTYWKVDTSNIRALGWEPKVTFEECVQDMCDQAKSL